ncbi:DNA replication complex GINs protein (nucleomorph) [Lotharella oceanica]|uniref:DNA replication complex GINs protein n=1 Tax=Lotharella oceanica TaxID=641309 RepID=A0A060DGG2_9EUKA|nr:DNA replication complex GINs protein [Lotharella oceanica]|mmetsp:Transcript_4855/g.9651  ORF Transcript_4855/g.9651 Transcript_4855/m.9651 type:complete len:176 (+) Transcript_4855:2346-2873(+)
MITKIKLEVLYFSLDYYYSIKIKNIFYLRKIIGTYTSLNELFGNCYYKKKTILPLWIAIFLYNRNYIFIKLPFWFNLNKLRKIFFYEKINTKTLYPLGNFYLEHFSLINTNIRHIFNKDFYKINLSLKQIKKFRIIKILNSFIIKNTKILLIKYLTFSEISLIKNTLLNILCYLI